MSTSIDATPETGQALVIGAGIAGMITARILCDHFASVVLLERDVLPDKAEARSGTPQARHFHSLFTPGARIINQLFPENDSILESAGAPRVEMGKDTVIYAAKGPWLRRHTGLFTRMCSRSLRDWSIRKQLVKHPRVRLIDGCEVTSLLGDGASVSGVRVRPRAGNGQRVELREDSLRADLVIDTSGRRARTVEWLVELGYPRAETQQVRSYWGYASRLVRFPNKPKTDLKIIADTGSAPDAYRIGSLSMIEGGNWNLTLGGMARHYPPTDEEGAVEWTRHLRTPLIHELLREAEPVTPFFGFRDDGSSIRHFDRMARWPEGFVALGDTVADFNPLYGQGMTIASLSAMELDRWLKQRRSLLRPWKSARSTATFQKRLAKTLQAPWWVASSEDSRWPTSEGCQRNAGIRLMHKYADQLLKLATEDPEVHQALMEVQMQESPPTALFKPTITAKLVRSAVAELRDRP